MKTVGEEISSLEGVDCKVEVSVILIIDKPESIHIPIHMCLEPSTSSENKDNCI